MVPHDALLLGLLLAAFLCVPAAAYSTSQLCTACRDMETAFRKGLDSSRRSNFGGGNTAWEESRLGAWAFSETRLVGVLEGVCKKATEPAICSSLVEEHEEAIEEWWNKKFSKDPKKADLFRFLCIQRLKVCCRELHFGAKCAPCPGLVRRQLEAGKSEAVACNGRGKCEGAGERSGAGHCDCDSGYEGDACNQCAEDHFRASGEVNSSALVCEKCHEACSGGCTGFGPANCSATCNSGWNLEDGGGCSDIDECANTSACGAREFCKNEPGSFSCEDCDPSCEACSGPGAENCTACAQGYRRGTPTSPDRPAPCEDVNECLEGGCSEGKVCKNLPGSHECACPEGLEENTEGKCVAKAAEDPKSVGESEEKSSHDEL